MRWFATVPKMNGFEMNSSSCACNLTAHADNRCGAVTRRFICSLVSLSVVHNHFQQNTCVIDSHCVLRNLYFRFKFPLFLTVRNNSIRNGYCTPRARWREARIREIQIDSGGKAFGCENRFRIFIVLGSKWIGRGSIEVSERSRLELQHVLPLIGLLMFGIFQVGKRHIFGRIDQGQCSIDCERIVGTANRTCWRMYRGQITGTVVRSATYEKMSSTTSTDQMGKVCTGERNHKEEERHKSVRWWIGGEFCWPDRPEYENYSYTSFSVEMGSYIRFPSSRSWTRKGLGSWSAWKCRSNGRSICKETEFEERKSCKEWNQTDAKYCEGEKDSSSTYRLLGTGSRCINWRKHDTQLLRQSVLQSITQFCFIPFFFNSAIDSCHSGQSLNSIGW